jgi:hypothetical protein
MDQEQIKQMIDERIAFAMRFQTKKYGDTPTDDLQLVPKKYVDTVTVTPGGPQGAVQFNYSSILTGSDALILDTTSINGYPILTLKGTIAGGTGTLVVADVDGAQVSEFCDRQFTTTATPTTVNTSVMIEMFTYALRTGGSAGAAADSAGYIRRAVYKNVAGTVSLVGAIQDGYTAEDQAAWDATFAISGTNIQAQFTGAANNNVTWDSTFRFYI